MKEKNQLLLLVNTLRFSQHIPNKLKVSSVNMLILACSVLNFFDDFLYLRAVLLSYNQSYNAIVIQRKLNKHNKKDKSTKIIEFFGGTLLLFQYVMNKFY